MSPEPLLLDEMPAGDDPFGDDISIAGKVPCPECGEYFKSRGLTRHLESAHGVENPNKRSGNIGNKSKGTAVLAQQWAEFQRGASLFASFACSQCAAVLMEDAQKDGDAIAAFCEGRPKLKKQIQQALTGMDIMILVGALGETARKMVSHHEIGKKLGMPGPQHTHAGGGSAQEKMMDFLTTMDPAARNTLLDQVFSGGAATASTPAAATPTVTVVMDDDVPGMPPTPRVDDLSEQDRYQMAMAHAGSDLAGH